MAEGTGNQGKPRSADALVFDLILVGFVGAIVAVSVSRLAPQARLVPLIIGVPTLVGVVLQLLADLFPGILSGRKSAGLSEDAAEGEPSASETAPDLKRETRRKIVFSAWAVGFFLLSAAFGFLVSIPAALLFFFRVINREGWVVTLSATIGAWAFVWLLFSVLLNVEL